MTTTVNTTIFENPERRKLYIESVKQKIEDGLFGLIANGLALEVTGKASEGCTKKCYLTLWKKHYYDELIYRYNIGHFM